MARFRAASLLDQLTALTQLRKQAKQRLVTQARQHADYRILSLLPGLGSVRIAQLLAIVDPPQRFRTKRQFWPYCGYAVCTRSSADYQIAAGQIVKRRKKVATRGLNRNHNPRLMRIFNGAAFTSLRHAAVKAYYE